MLNTPASGPAMTRSPKMKRAEEDGGSPELVEQSFAALDGGATNAKT